MSKIVNRLFPVVCLATLATATAMLSGCGGGGGEEQQVYQPQPGERMSVGIERQGRQGTPTLVYEATYRWTEMNEAESDTDTPEKPTVFALLESETYHDLAFQSVMPPINPVTEEELRTFLRDHWDAFHGGVDDEGWNIESFLTFLRDHQISMEKFFDMWEDWQAHGGTLPELVDWINRFWSRGLHDPGPASPRDGRGYLEAGITATKLAWDIIKSNAPVTNVHGAFTSILNPGDTNWTHYSGARNNSSDTWTYWSKNVLGAYVFYVKFHASCDYNASHATLGGRYIPSLYVVLGDITVGWGWSLDGNASLSSISNIGTTQNPNPRVDMIVTLNPHSFLQNFSNSFLFRATGTGGVSEGTAE